MLSIIIPCRNEEKFIGKCLDSVLNSDLSFDDYEILVVDGASSDNTRAIINEYSIRFNQIILLDNLQKTVPYAMNLGIKQAKGDIVIRLDAHAKYDINYFKYLVDNLKKYDADNVGTIIKTTVDKKTLIGQSIIAVTSDKLGVGNSLFRTGISEPREVDTVPFGCYRRDVFSTIGYYDERLKKSQDLELNKRLKAAGGKIILLPNHPVIYYARSGYRSIAKKYLANGKWNIWVAFITDSLQSLSPRSFTPMIFITTIILAMILSFFHNPVSYFFYGIITIYLLAIGIRSIQIADNFFSIFTNLIAFIVIHFSHGIGGLIGLLSILFTSKVNKIKKKPRWI